MAITEISPAGNLEALDRYTGSIAAKDADSPEPTQRDEFVSTIGDCTPEHFVDRVRANARRFGKEKLKHEAYHLIVSQTHEEADQRDPQAGHRQHTMVRELARRRFPGHMAKLVTQRDNGRWVEVDGERVWQPGKWHTHCIIANVSSREAVLELVDKDGTPHERHERHYAAGRAIDGAKKNIHQIRHGPGGTDEQILEHFGYDNARYVEECRSAAKGRGDRATTRDVVQRADPDGRGYSNHDEVRVKLRAARALADSWDDYTARLAADGVHTRVTGASGVSYAWVSDDGVEHKASARSRKGRDGLGNDFTRAEVEAQCAINAERIGRGETLDVPERAPVPAPPAPAERPVPVYLTPGGRPPWERDADAFAARVRESGGTYEGRAREAVDAALADALDRDDLVAVAAEHGVEIAGDDTVRVRSGRRGRVAVALDTERAERVRSVEPLDLGEVRVDRIDRIDINESAKEEERDDLDDIIDLDGIEIERFGGAAEGAGRGAERGGGRAEVAHVGGGGARGRDEDADRSGGGPGGADQCAERATPLRDRAVADAVGRDDGGREIGD
ncbi:hypothetical protein Gbro_0561 [Gordonia bronchialis DSM 43247]|uniref:Uncharacterized protein n=1 Tax=Gordonia bronchialis (strain ATCC 25592 / DSM 43247 / BCRC 13721 / JCM 3198 / KCTC 3076 / NBRC 16047 / NCTC 10667) TaxID=526226 RepID=D0LEH3_GORB4|nr:hypothetical protein [Gordonia bronchialis]ACY19891.1 hypothetical protein Gbro_0561 [Gordonia bronchialis DSM 43247]MCC3322663.1 hypothetical protein [Gordonia bronchialis]QGS26242.1 hypothetical protein FOB84_21030 [Gordonia bronchialis]STQ62668.1 Uncharacterised protein [Gordonia bronchialis]